MFGRRPATGVAVYTTTVTSLGIGASSAKLRCSRCTHPPSHHWCLRCCLAPPANTQRWWRFEAWEAMQRNCSVPVSRVPVGERTVISNAPQGECTLGRHRRAPERAHPRTRTPGRLMIISGWTFRVLGCRKEGGASRCCGTRPGMHAPQGAQGAPRDAPKHLRAPSPHPRMAAPQDAIDTPWGARALGRYTCISGRPVAS